MTRLFQKNLPVALMILLALAGCATTKAQQEGNRLMSLAREVNDKYKTCRSEQASNPKYSRLYEKFGVGLDHMPSSTQLNDTESITSEDIALAFDWYPETEHCDTDAIDGLSKIDPELAVIQSKGIRQANEILRNLIVGSTTYADINQQILQLKTSQRAVVSDWGHRLGARLKEMQDQELGENREAAENFIRELTEVIITVARIQASISEQRAKYIATHPSYKFTKPITRINCSGTGSLTCSNRVDIYGQNGQMQGTVINDNIYSQSGQPRGRIINGLIYNQSGQPQGNIVNGYIYNMSGQPQAYFR